jgi:hypothetical protein
MKKFDPANASGLAISLIVGSAKAISGQDPALPLYHPPHIALVQPAPGQSLQQDKPVVVIRFAAGEANDPIDVRSFAISVDAKDKTNLFDVSATEAWGAIASVPSDLSIGNHEIAARICSARGACSSTSSTITISKPLIAAADTTSVKGITKKRRVVNALLSALRTLIKE